MMEVEYVRSLNCNYERIHLDKRPEEKKYQYCILSRGGIKGLLPCDLRYINGDAYLYYDISSKQNVEQLYCNRNIDRQWIIDFMWSVKQIRQELERFLLDERNVIWLPNQVFLDLESKAFSFLYIPYYEGEFTFCQMTNYWLEHLDYEDEELVECVYRINDQLVQFGEEYFKSKIYEDVKQLEENKTSEYIKEECEDQIENKGMMSEENIQERYQEYADLADASGFKRKSMGSDGEGKRSWKDLLEIRRHKNKKYRDEYQYAMKQAMNGHAVAEEVAYEALGVEESEEEGYGRTIYIEETELRGPKVFRVHALDGSLLATVNGGDLSIGKKRDEVDLALEDSSVSRLHARIIIEQEVAYLEDLNSTNGTYKNGLRLRPYEKRKLDAGDEIKCGKVPLIFRY